MYAQTSSITPTGSVIRNYFVSGGWPFQLRHAETWATVRGVVGVWLLSLATILVTQGYGWAAFLYVVAAKELVFCYRLRETIWARRR